MLIQGQDIREIFNEIFSKIGEIEGGYSRFIILAVCLIIIALLNRKDIAKVCIPTVLSVVLLIEPHLYVYLYKDTSYKRFFWILPEAILLAYTIVLVLSHIKKSWVKWLGSILAIAVLLLTGTCIYSEESGYFTKASNWEHVDPSTAALAEAIIDIEPNPTCVIPIQAADMIRVAEPDIVQVGGRNYLGYMGNTEPVITKLVTNVSSLTPDSDYIFSVASSKQLDIVVTLAAAAIDESTSSQYGYEKMGNIGEYCIYYNSNPGPDADEWYITQYGPDWGKNYFYTIEDSDGSLIIVDGGHYGNASILKSIIRDHDYHVYAWIFTTLSDHHIGAAYDVLSDYEGLITIDNIYIQQYSDEMLDIVYADQADWEVGELQLADEFVELVNQFDNVVYLEEGDDYSLSGLTLHVYHTWNEEVEEIGFRESSNSSVVFSVTGNEESMLFTSYTTLPIENDIFDAIGENQFDYVTANDHGEWVFDYWWYDDRNPTGVFIDEYTAALSPDGNAFAFYSYCLEKGYNVYTFETVPNRITIK